MAFEKILVVDDDLIIRKTLTAHLQKQHYKVANAENIADALKILQQDAFDLILLDERLPDGMGSDLLGDVKQTASSSAFTVMMSGYATLDGALQCMRQGAFDYIVKPFSLEQIDVALKRAENYDQLVRVNQYYTKELNPKSELLGQSPAVLQLKKVIRKVAATEATVLVLGENGTGKELVANELHRLSNLADRPFIKVNCAAISESLIESEFFGHEKGAFTGAAARKPGRFELADGGTILLDEIGEISPRIQAKLLRVLQEREFERVGGTKTISVKVRVIATTNRDLLEAVRRGEFREDLYYRLSVFPIDVPSLRERGEDILLLARSFAQRFAQKHRQAGKGFTPDAEQRLMQHPWPGNVRELHNTIERAVILTEPNQPIEVISLHLPRPRQAAPSPYGAPPAGGYPPAGVYGGYPHGVGDTPPIVNGGTFAAGSQPPPGYGFPYPGYMPPNAGYPQYPQTPPPQHYAPPPAQMPPPEPSRTVPTMPDPLDFGDDDDEAADEKPVTPRAAATPSPETDSGELMSLEDLERRQILKALEVTEGNRAKAAEMLKISTRTLRNKINQYRDEGLVIE
ncbi:MAG: sigma-54 dependent transcriptional regulator [Verrucomicrobiota bacterium JB022]|nr:sigma-54 dependent transcriptional regulator [Verrucomicrobiota bacterium JB022]